MTLLITVIAVSIICFLIALAVHEAGHALVAQWYEWDWHIKLKWYGVGIETDECEKTRSQRFMYAAGGPFLSFLFIPWVLTFPDLTVIHYLLAGFSLDFAVINLIPFFGLSDGSHMLAALRAPK